MNTKEIFERYLLWKEKGLDYRYIPTKKIEKLLQHKGYQNTVVGTSFQGKPIYKLSLGRGKKKVLIWSQMHGNESTGTRAMFDVFNLLCNEQFEVFSQKILTKLTIEYIPQLNPDGADLYTRRNAMGIDINRDFIQEASPEIKILKSLVFTNVYKCLFNLHDQRSVFNVKNKTNGTLLSLLSPVIDEVKTTNKARKNAIEVVSSIYKSLQMYKDNLAKFSEDFYPKATGDNFQKNDVPIILFESGHTSDDYLRIETRKVTAFAIVAGLYKLAKTNDASASFEKAWEQYKSIPENEPKALDIILRNVGIENESERFITDIGIQYEEVLDKKEGVIKFVPKIYEIGDLSDFFGHKEWDMKKQSFRDKKNYTIGEIFDLRNIM